MSEPDRAAVARAIRDEMKAQGMNTADLVEASGLNYRTVRAAMRGERWMLTTSQIRIADALSWERNWIELIGDGFPLKTLKARRRDANQAKLRDPATTIVDDATWEELQAALARLREREQ